MKPMNYMRENEFIESDPFTEKIIGLAIEVHSVLGAGFVESVYQSALCDELTTAGIPFQSQALLEVKYKGKSAGTFIADLIVEEKLLLELKAVEGIATAHEVQLVNYLNATGLDLGLVLNFGATKLQIKRKFRKYMRPDQIRFQEV